MVPGPSVWVPDGFAFRQIYDFPLMVLNSSGATSTDTIHRMRSHGAKPERLIANTYTWLTAASAEIEGRSFDLLLERLRGSMSTASTRSSRRSPSGRSGT